ncbi:hypothetical protein F7725_028622 [Dissostichus mawsoni]|uniref:Biogenesis of lysosome-related organelles complex 1 subunit 5 n=1 Tax=Dissostichus mawsoni TaxID=36200 RepID=A0A7J5XG99_DISMA|nr:hypothetical protein F7725_028622 [Dissostichus mawsoni]
MDKIAKDVGDIQSRLLDHRPVINAEIRYFVREFEEKRGHRESRLLENLNKIVTETNEQMLPTDLEGMLSNVFTRGCCKSHGGESPAEGARGPAEHPAAGERGASEGGVAEFLKEQQRLKEEVDEEHAKAVGQLSTTYNEKKNDLTKFSPL